MVQGVGGTGNSGSLSNISAYNIYKSEWETYRKKHPESSMPFEDFLQMNGYLTYFNSQVENYIETGDSNNGDGKKGNTINITKSLSSSSSSIYQTEDEDTFYEFDYNNGTYRQIQGKEEIAKALGMPEDADIDTVIFGLDSVAITDYTFGDLDDGQDSSSQRLSGKYSNVSYTKQEFDIDYILNALLMDPTDPQYKIAKSIFDNLSAHASQWLPESDLNELNAIAEEFGTNSAEYKDKLKEVLLKNLDQAQEWVDDHTHVKNTSTGSLTDMDNTNGTGGTDGSDGSESTTGTIPDYDKSKVLDGAGLLADYTNNTSHKCDSISLKGRSSDQARNEAFAKANEYASQVLDQTISSLTSQLGDKYTDEIQTYISKAKEATLADTGSWRDYDYDGGMLRKNRHYTGFVKTQPLINKFFEEFNTLCQNKGKTTAEVEAEKKAAEEKAAREKQAYQNIYNTDFKSLGNEAGVNKDIQVVNVTSASEIQAKAESEILTPLKNKILSKYSGTIPSSDLQTMLDNSAKAALADCTEWASTSNNFVYTIDADKLISKFQENVKTVINNKGVLA